MFDSLQQLAGNLVVPVIYRATLKLMRSYQAGGPDRSQSVRVGELAASSDKARTAKNKRASRRSQIEAEVAEIFREIEAKEQKPVSSLSLPEASKYVGMLSEIAARRSAKTFVDSSVSSSEAKRILVQLRAHYR